MTELGEFTYDLIVIGSGPAGQKAAIQAAKLGKRVAIIEKKNVVGGICTNFGTIPSKTLREAVLHFSGYREKSIYGSSYVQKQTITINDLLFRTNHVMRHEIDVIRHQLARNNVELINAQAAFIDPHVIAASSATGQGQRIISTDKIIIATGTKATEDPSIEFDGQSIFTADGILGLSCIPPSLTVIGAGVIGCEYASIFAALGVRVTLIDKRDRLLPFLDNEVSDALAYQLREKRVTLRFEEEVESIEILKSEPGNLVELNLKSGKRIVTNSVLYSIGRTGNTEDLNLEAVGITVDGRGRIPVNKNYQTSVQNIYAVGDVIGFPSLASTSMEQGRIACCNAFGQHFVSLTDLFPYGIYSIPEISMVGRNEQELTKNAVPYEIGRACYREIARGQIIGDQIGLLKILFHIDTHQILGVHILGEGASELIHIGQAVMAHDGRLEYFINSVFNYPTLAECYKTAAFDGLNRIHHIEDNTTIDNKPESNSANKILETQQ